MKITSKAMAKKKMMALRAATFLLNDFSGFMTVLLGTRLTVDIGALAGVRSRAWAHPHGARAAL
jgi:hypothetical protein